MNRILIPAELLLLLTAAIWGGSYSMVKSALVFYPVAGVIALRFLLSALLLLPYWLRLPRAVRPKSGRAEVSDPRCASLADRPSLGRLPSRP